MSYVKLDGEFIQNLPRSEVDEHMVKAIVGVSQALGIKTVAESVADEETIGLLQKHHVDYAQGYLRRQAGPAERRRSPTAGGCRATPGSPPAARAQARALGGGAAARRSS